MYMVKSLVGLLVPLVMILFDFFEFLNILFPLPLYQFFCFSFVKFLYFVFKLIDLTFQQINIVKLLKPML